MSAPFWVQSAISGEIKMELYLLRHGVAYEGEEWARKSADDNLRPLTDAGIAAMEREAAYLKNAHTHIDMIVTSPLVRARDTARIVGKALGLEPRESDLLKPGFNTKDLAALLEEYAQVEHLMLVGHNPDLGQVIQRVTGGEPVDVPKGGLARLDILQRNPPRGTLYSLLPPKALGA